VGSERMSQANISSRASQTPLHVLGSLSGKGKKRVAWEKKKKLRRVSGPFLLILTEV